MPASTAAVLEALVRSGLLMKQDKRLPSVVTLIAGAPLASSWWSHAQSQRIFRVLCELADHPDVLVTKLLFAKDTLVHRALWPALLTVATSAEHWQTDRLSPAARALLGRTRTARTQVVASGVPVRELTSRLLVHAVEVHTPGGKHRVAVEPWSCWAARAGVLPLSSLVEARGQLEAATARFGAPLAALPWRTTRVARRGGKAEGKRAESD